MRFAILVLFTTIPYLNYAQDSLSKSFKIYSTADQKIVSLDAVAAQMRNADVLFFGEEHNDATEHHLELSLLTRLAKDYAGKAALSMEMFETDCQLPLNEYLEGMIREQDYIKDAKVWDNYADYRPLIEFAKAEKIAVIAANAPNRYVKLTNMQGLDALLKLSAEAKRLLPPLPIDTAVGAYFEKFSQLMGGHGGFGGFQLYQAQSLWDASMGYMISKFLAQHPGFKLLQINGGFHSEERLGTVAQLKHYAPLVKAITIAAYAADDFASPNWSKYVKNADYIILTDPQLAKSF